MKIKLLIAAALAAASCQTTGPQRDAIVQKGSERLLSFGANLVVSGGEQLPSASPEFDYASDDASDLRLHSSLSSLDSVRGALPDGSSSMPMRMNYWLQRVEQSDGEVLTCDVNTDPGFGGAFLLFVLQQLGEMALSEVREYALYRPAAQMNAVIERDSSNGELKAVSFYRRETTTDSVRQRYIRCAE